MWRRDASLHNILFVRIDYFIYNLIHIIRYLFWKLNNSAILYAKNSSNWPYMFVQPLYQVISISLNFWEIGNPQKISAALGTRDG